MSVYRPRDKEGKERSRTYLYDFKIKPKGATRSQRFHGSTGQVKKAAAERVEQRLKELAKTGELSSAITVSEACEKYWDERMVHARSADDQATNLEVISTFIGPDTLLVDVTPELVASAAATLARTPIKRYHRGLKELVPTQMLRKAASVNRQLIEPLRRLLKYARRTWRVPIDLEDFDWSALRYTEPEGIVRELSATDERRYWECLRPDYHPIMEMYLISGRRKSDWCGLLRFRLSRNMRTVTHLSHKKKQAGELVVTLTDHEYEILDEEIRKAPDSEYVFTYEVQSGPDKGKRRPINKDSLRQAHEIARRYAGLPDFRIHDCRHTFASRLLRAKRDLKLLMKSLDHSDITSTVRYARVLDEDVRSARQESKTYRTEAEHNVVDLRKRRAKP